MKIEVVVKANARTESVEKISEQSFIVKVRVPPVDNQANIRVGELLAEYLGIAKSKLTLKHGSKSKRKIFIITE